jgi:hypothetical protein
MDKLRAGVTRALAVFPQSPAFLQPGEAALDDPALGDELEDMSVTTLGKLYRHMLAQYLAHLLRKGSACHWQPLRSRYSTARL